MVESDNFLKHIRQKHNLKTAFNGIHVITIYRIETAMKKQVENEELK